MATLMFAAVFTRNHTPFVASAAAVNNVALPLWMLTLGVALCSRSTAMEGHVSGACVVRFVLISKPCDIAAVTLVTTRRVLSIKAMVAKKLTDDRSATAAL